MTRLLFFIFLFSSSSYLQAQDSLRLDTKSIGVEYFGELGLHPGIKVDFGIPLTKNLIRYQRERFPQIQQLHLRPNIGYYYLPKYTNNFFIGTDLALQLKSKVNQKNKIFYFESIVGLAYLRYNYVGTVYESTNSGDFNEKKLAGGNSFLLTTGFVFGGNLIKDRVEWLIGFEYFIEFSEDKLIIQHPALRLGCRTNLLP